MAYDPQAALMMASGGLNAGGGTGYAPSILSNRGAMGATGTPNATGTNLWDLPLLNTIPGMDWTTQSEGPQVYQPSFPTTPIPNVTPPTAANTGGVTPQQFTKDWEQKYTGMTPTPGFDWKTYDVNALLGKLTSFGGDKAGEQAWIKTLPWEVQKDLSTPRFAAGGTTPPLNWDLIKGPGQTFQQPGGVTQTIQASNGGIVPPNLYPVWKAKAKLAEAGYTPEQINELERNGQLMTTRF